MTMAAAESFPSIDRSQFIITDKYLDVAALSLKPYCNLLVFEGSIRSSKTEDAKPIFHMNVAASNEELHLIAGNDLDAIRDNILDGEHGLLAMFPDLELVREKLGSYFLLLHSRIPNVYPKEKKILLAGYSTKSKWKKVLGKSLGVILIDEVNTADKLFVDECFARQGSVDRPLQIWTLNGDIPELWVYQDYINRCNVMKKYRATTPASILADMDKVKKEPGWFYVHFTFTDNPIMTPAKIARTMEVFPVGSYYYTIKVLGERGSPGELIYLDYMDPDKLIKPVDLRKYPHCVVGCDIGASRAQNSFNLQGFSLDYYNTAFIDKVTFQQLGYENKKERLIAFVRMWLARGANIEYISIDSAEANFISDISTTFRALKLPPIIPSFKATIKERIDMGIILFSSGRCIFNDTPAGRDCYDAFKMAKWAEGKKGQEREDKNEPHNDKIDATEYSWTRHMHKMMSAFKQEAA